MGDSGYSLDMTTPVRHVATEMDRAAGTALSIEEMATTYRHPNPSDITRIRKQEGCSSDDEAIEWLLHQAIEAITHKGKTNASKQQIESNGHGYRLAVPFEDLEFNDKKIHRIRDDHAQLGDPFNPNSGIFAGNIRRGKPQHSREDDALRESMADSGWLPDHPAIIDERGVTLVGHRRLAMAEELGIEPDVKRVHFGDGDVGDIERLKLAFRSNTGAKPFSKSDLAEIAGYLAERGWGQTSIAEALSVAQSTISKALTDVGFIPRNKTPSGPKGGRPKGSNKRKAPPELDSEVLNLVEAEKPVPREQLATEFGVGKHAVNLAHQRAIGAIEERQRREAGQCTCPNCGDVHNIST